MKASDAFCVGFHEMREYSIGRSTFNGVLEGIAMARSDSSGGWPGGTTKTTNADNAHKAANTLFFLILKPF